MCACACSCMCVCLCVCLSVYSIYCLIKCGLFKRKTVISMEDDRLSPLHGCLPEVLLDVAPDSNPLSLCTRSDDQRNKTSIKAIQFPHPPPSLALLLGFDPVSMLMLLIFVWKPCHGWGQVMVLFSHHRVLFMLLLLLRMFSLFSCSFPSPRNNNTHGGSYNNNNNNVLHGVQFNLFQIIIVILWYAVVDKSAFFLAGLGLSRLLTVCVCVCVCVFSLPGLQRSFWACLSVRP